MTRRCSGRKIVPSEVSPPFLLFVQSKLLYQGFRDLLCRFPGTDSIEIIILRMKLLQIILHGLDRGLIMVPVLCAKVKLH